MKYFLFCLLGLFGLTKGCHVHHDHSQQVPHARVAVDSAQHNDVATEDRSWEKEDLIVVPEPMEPLSTLPGEAQDDIERMMRGESIDGE